MLFERWHQLDSLMHESGKPGVSQRLVEVVGADRRDQAGQAARHGDRGCEPVEEGLKRAAGFLRSKLGRALEIRHVPELRFAHDDSAEESARISQLIHSALHTDDRE